MSQNEEGMIRRWFRKMGGCPQAEEPTCPFDPAPSPMPPVTDEMREVWAKVEAMTVELETGERTVSFHEMDEETLAAVASLNEGGQ